MRWKQTPQLQESIVIPRKDAGTDPSVQQKVAAMRRPGGSNVQTL